MYVLEIISTGAIMLINSAVIHQLWKESGGATHRAWDLRKHRYALFPRSKIRGTNNVKRFGAQKQSFPIIRLFK
jgi:hypothetical protein